MSLNVSYSLAALKSRRPVLSSKRITPAAKRSLPSVDGFAARMLRRHVRDLAFQAPARRVVAELARALRDAEIDDLHVAAESDHDVLGRDVAMDDVERSAVEIPLLVGVCEPRADPERHREGML